MVPARRYRLQQSEREERWKRKRRAVTRGCRPSVRRLDFDTAGMLWALVPAISSTTGSVRTSPASIAASANFHGSSDRLSRSTVVGLRRWTITHGSKSEWLFLANAYADLGTWWCVTPFIGAGIGGARVTDQQAFAMKVIGQSQRSATAIFQVRRTDQLRASESGISLGLFMRVLHTKSRPSLTMELAYRYVDMGDGLTGPVTTYTGFTTNNPMNFKAYHFARSEIWRALESRPGSCLMRLRSCR